MDFLLHRFRNLTALVLLIGAQLVLLAYQVRNNQDVRLIRVWAVTAVTPLARVLEAVRAGTIGVVQDYFVLTGVRRENRRLSEELGRLKMENQFLKSELATADRAQALAAFGSRTPSKTIAARVIGSGTGTNAKVVFVDRGTANGVAKGMAVVTPDGIVGKVQASYPTASQVLLITDASFAAGVVSQKNRVTGTLKGQGHGTCIVDYVQNEEKLDVGEMFYTSGDDRVFPKGLPVGTAKVVRGGKTFKEIFITPDGFRNGVEEVLIVIEGVHQPIPDAQVASSQVHLLQPPPAEPGSGQTVPGTLVTDADRLKERYRRIGEAQKHVFGEGLPGSRPPNFNLDPSGAMEAGGTGAPSRGSNAAGQSAINQNRVARPQPSRPTAPPATVERPSTETPSVTPPDATAPTAPPAEPSEDPPPTQDRIPPPRPPSEAENGEPIATPPARPPATAKPDNNRPPESQSQR